MNDTQLPTDPDQISIHLDAIVDHLLRDRDFQIANEITTKVEQLNELLVLAGGQGLKVEISSIDTNLPDGTLSTAVTAAVYKRIR